MLTRSGIIRALIDPVKLIVHHKDDDNDKKN